VALGVVGAGLAALTASSGCSYSSADNAQTTSFHDGGDDAAEVTVEVGFDAPPSTALCGDLHPGTCNPDNGEICTPLDAGSDDASSDSAPEGAIDTGGSGSKLACRVVRINNAVTTTCRPAGLGAIDSFCTHDADCAPGLACVGAGVLTQCKPYCCSATDFSDPCRKMGRYCTPQPVVERLGDYVPVCVQPDPCTLLPDPDSATEDCQSGSACTVVTQYGDTACVQTGPLTDLQCCSSDPWATNDQRCAAGYACLGPRGDRVCRKLCRVDDAKACGTSGHCEPQSSLPAGYGICTVDVADAAAEAGCGT